MDGTRDRSAVDLLRKCAAQDHGMGRLRDALGVGLESGWQQRCLARVADMMEAELDGIEELEAELEAEREEAAFWETRYYNEVKKRTKAEQCIAVMEFALKVICNRFGVSTKWAAEDAAKKVLAVLEREYMKLPVDADGEPIRPGDMLTYDGIPMEVIAVSDSPWFDRHPTEMLLSCEDATSCRHVKPDTVESLLDEFADEVRRCCDDEATVVDFSERIRKAVEHEAE